MRSEIIKPGTTIQPDQETSRAELLRFRCAQLFVLALPFQILFSNIALYLLLLTTLLSLRKTSFRRIPKQVLLFQAVYFLGVLGYFYSFNKSSAGFLLERQLTILLIPLLLPLSFELNETRKQNLLHCFAIGQVIAILFLFVSALLVLHELQLPLKSLFSREFFNHQFSAPLGIHAGYLSLYVCLSMLHLMRFFFYAAKPVILFLILPAQVILLSGLVFLASRNVILSGILILLFIFPFFFITKRIRFYTIAGLFLVAGYLAITKISYLRDRFSSELLSDIRPGGNSYDGFNTVEPRVQRWRCATKLIQQSPLMGYGTGDEVPMLKAMYIRDGLYISYLESFNAHNQYLSFAVKNGIPGLLIFIAIFGYYIRLALKHRSYIYLCFLTLLVIGFFTENILDANKGIFFFAFFNTLLGYTLLRQEKTGSTGPVE